MKNHVTVKVSVNCIIEQNDKVLLVQEAIGRIRGFWSIPGGKVDEGESFKEAAKREIKEETDLDVVNIQKISIIQEEPNQTVNHIFKVQAKGNPKPQANEILDIKWFSLKEVVEIKDKLRKPWVLEIIENYLKNKND
jgi:8-oxo-dGTP diphosphatase